MYPLIVSFQTETKREDDFNDKIKVKYPFANFHSSSNYKTFFLSHLPFEKYIRKQF